MPISGITTDAFNAGLAGSSLPRDRDKSSPREPNLAGNASISVSGFPKMAI
jgi:hypothetical protein